MKLHVPTRRSGPSYVLELDQPALPSEKARSLLRRLRDLNLHTDPIAIRSGRSVTVGGCMSIDAPVEGGVRYRLRVDDGTEGVLELAWQSNELSLSVRFASEGSPAKSLSIALSCDRKGRACARLLAARVSPESRDRRELEHFVRRIVRTLAR